MDTVEGLVSVASQSYPGPQRKTSGLTSKLCLMVGIMMSFLSDPFVDEVEGYIDVPRFCIVLVSNTCVDEVEDLVSPRLRRTPSPQR